MRTSRNGPFALSLVCAAFLISCTSQRRADPDVTPLVRQYAEGETTRYIMTGVNQGREHTFNYSAHAEGIVKRDANGRFIEEFRWTQLSFGGQQIPLDEPSLNFRQLLSLDPNVDMTPPDVRGINPMLIGPVFDLMTFYVDLHPSLHQGRLKQVGDRTHVAHGLPNSWADGTKVIIGQDCIDFDLMLQRLEENFVVLNVRHVPPAESGIDMPADWMHERVNPESPNNWVQVQRADADTSNSGAQVVAAAGYETFDVVIEIERPSGRIVKATMDNPVDVVQRHCDQAFEECGEPVKYRIHRRIELKRTP